MNSAVSVLASIAATQLPPVVTYAIMMKCDRIDIYGDNFVTLRFVAAGVSPL